jgi:sugar lactone lactonase YvrE
LKRFDLHNLRFVGEGLSRPECALAHSSGHIFVPDWTDNGGVSIVLPNGETHRHLAKNWESVASKLGFEEPLRPNGICLLPDGEFLLAHLGAERGGVFKLAADGTISPVLLEVDGEVLPPTNFVTVDAVGRIWVTVSTRHVPRAAAYRKDICDGFIVLLENNTARVVADELGYTNECLVHLDGKRLFVNETFSRRLTSFDISENGDLSNRTTVAELGHGVFPDGLAFDEHGDAWLTSIVSNRVLRVGSSGDVQTYIEDVDPNHLDWVEQAWLNHSMGRPHLDKAAGAYLKNVSNLAFSGPDLKQAVLGCLLGDQLAVVDMPVQGAKPVHWDYDIAPLLGTLERN